MSDSSFQNKPTLPLDGAWTALRDRYAAELRAGRQPRLEDFLTLAAKPQRPALLRELLLLAIIQHVRVVEGTETTERPSPVAGGGSADAALDPTDVKGATGASDTNCSGEGPELGRVGRYRIEGEIACGGMGRVLRARDVDLDRPLAIKVMLERHQGRPLLERRFREEARITGQLQHPGIPPVHEVGTLPDGRPFFALKLIQGATLAELLHKRPAATADWPHLLGIFAVVCQTLAYAHSRGVIHRDLKPLNIMVGAFGEVQVMDWGLAKVLKTAKPQAEDTEDSSAACGFAVDAEPHTHAGTVVGTPGYMAPEQALGEIDLVDERCDVFGLGALLCIILTGSPPWADSTREATLCQAQKGDPQDAFVRLDASGADTELIGLAKACLARRREDRPANAAEVAQALAAYQAGVQQRLQRAEIERAAAQARAGEERKRRRLALCLATAVLSLVVLGAGAGLWLQRQSAATAFRLERARQTVAAGLAQVDTLRRQARWIDAGAILTRLEEQFDQDEPLFADQLQQARANLRLAAQLDAIRLEQAAIVDGRFRIERAAPAYVQAFQDAGLDVILDDPQNLAGAIATSAIREELIAALDDWLAVEPDKGRKAQLRAVLQRADPDSTKSKVRDLMVERQSLLLDHLMHEVHAEQLSPALAVHLATLLKDTQAIALLQRLRTQYPGDFWVNFNLASRLYQQPGRCEEADGYYRVALGIRPDSPAVQLNLGAALQKKGDLDGALAAYDKALALSPDLALAHNNRGTVLRTKGDLDGAITCFRKAIAADWTCAQAQHNLGSALQARGDIAGALVASRQAIAADPNLGEAHLQLGALLMRRREISGAAAAFRRAIKANARSSEAHYNLGVALQEQGRSDEAIASYRKAIALESRLGQALNNLGNLLEKAGDGNGALDAYRKASESDAGLTQGHYNLGRLLLARKEFDGAIAAFGKAVASEPTFAPAHHDLGVALYARGKLDDAIAAFRLATRVKPRLATAWFHLGVALKDKGKLDEAIAACRQAVSAAPENGRAHYNLALALKDLGRLDEAITAFQQAAVLLPQDAVIHNDLGTAFYAKKKLRSAIDAFRAAIKVNPRHAKAHYNLGVVLKDRGRSSEAITAYRQAVEIDPTYAQAWNNLGVALEDQGKTSEAIASWIRCTEADPKYAAAYLNLGRALKATGDVDGSIRAYRQAITCGLDTASGHNALGLSLYARKDFQGASAAYHKAIAKDGRFVQAHVNLGVLLKESGDIAGAITAFRRAIEVDDRCVLAHFNLGVALYDKGDLTGAVAAQRRAVARDPGFALGHFAIGQALFCQERFREAGAATQRSLRLLPASHPLRAPAGEHLQRCERLAAQDRLPAIPKGDVHPDGVDLMNDLAILRQKQKRFHAAARFHAASFVAKPDLCAQHRYNAACAAVLAAAGQGPDAADLNDKERIRLRKQALGWLRAELEAHGRIAAKGQAQACLRVRDVLDHWRKDADLASLRETAVMVNLPSDERTTWRHLWADVEALRKKTTTQGQ